MAKLILSNLLKDLNTKFENLEQINDRQNNSILFVKTNEITISQNIAKFNSIMETKKIQLEKNNVKPIDKHEGRSKSKTDLNKTKEGLSKTNTEMSKSHKNLTSNALNKSSTSILKNNQSLNVSTNKPQPAKIGKSIEKNKSVTKITPVKSPSNTNISNTKTNITTISAVKKPEKSRNVSKDKKQLVNSESAKTASTTKVVPKQNTKNADKKEVKLTKQETVSKIPLRQKTPGKINTNSNLKEDNKSTVTTASSKARITTLKENLKPNTENKIPAIYSSKDVDTKTDSGSLSKKGKDVEISVKSSKDQLKIESPKIDIKPTEVVEKIDVEVKEIIKEKVIDQTTNSNSNTQINNAVPEEKPIVIEDTKENIDVNYNYISDSTRKVKFIVKNFNSMCRRGQTTIFDMLNFSEKTILINSNKTIRKVLRENYKEVLLKDVKIHMDEWTTKKFQILDVS